MRKYLLHSLSFFPLIFWDFLLCALPERSLLFVRPIIVVALGLGWAGRLGRLTDCSFFWFSTFFIQATGERGRCVDNNNNNNNVTRVDSSRSLSRYDGYYYHHHHTSELPTTTSRAVFKKRKNQDHFAYTRAYRRAPRLTVGLCGRVAYLRKAAAAASKQASKQAK